MRQSSNKHHHNLAIPQPQGERVRGLIAMAIYGALALGAFVVGSAFGNIHSSDLHTKVTAWVAAGVFLVFGVISTRHVANMAGHIVATRTIVSAGAAVRLVGSIAGYVIVLFMVLGVLDVSIEHLLVGGALTGVVLGIAAQQSLGNVFAGIVLLLARPYGVGDHVRVRSGQLGGEFDGVVLAVSLTYVTIFTDGGPLKIPNSAMLGSAVGPYVPSAPHVDPPHEQR